MSTGGTRLTEYGFQMDAIEVVRAISHKGYAVIHVKTPRQWLEIVSTPTGLLRVGKVWPVKREAKGLPSASPPA